MIINQLDNFAIRISLMRPLDVPLLGILVFSVVVFTHRKECATINLQTKVLDETFCAVLERKTHMCI